MSRAAIETPTDDTAQTTLGRFTDVQERAPDWLWPDWLPLGKLAILDGDPGLGKSTLMFDLAARVSKDGIMPDGSQGATGSVIIANAEDDLHDTIKPRLLAAGANAERLFHISEVGPAGARRPLRIPADVPLIGRFIKECSARLLIVDPLTAFLAGVDINREQDIRKVLMLLSSLAREHGCTLICVRHLNKWLFGNALYRGGGSIGVIGHARTGLLVAQAPDNEDERILAVAKSNPGRMPASLRFALAHEEGACPHASCRIRWLGAAPFRARDLAVRPPNGERGHMDRACQDFLRQMLRRCSTPVKSAKAECADAGFSVRTTERAANKLGVVLKRKYGMNMWALPGDDT
jgi:hypothetical protein